MLAVEHFPDTSLDTSPEISPSKSKRQTLADAFDPRHNSLNALRLTFALLVVIGHSWLLGLGNEAPALGSLGFQNLAVDGFFVISGFLITRSRLKTKSTTDFLKKRFLRIYPGYWFCLLLGALLFAPVMWIGEHGSLSGYFTASNNNFITYMVTNVTIFIHQYGIAGVMQQAHVPDSINGSLWTLVYEVLAYAMVAVFFALGILRYRKLVLALTVACLAIDVWLTYDFDRFQALTGIHTVHIKDPSRLIGMFLVGMCLYLWADRIEFSNRLAALSAVGLLFSGLFDNWRMVGMFFFAYLIFWAAIRLPFQKVGSKVDLSYGIYLYGWPCQLIYWQWGIAEDYGLATYIFFVLANTIGFAYVSWTLVESPAIKLKGKRIPVQLSALTSQFTRGASAQSLSRS